MRPANAGNAGFNEVPADLFYSGWRVALRSSRNSDKLPADSAVADEKRLQFNDELRRHSKLAVVFDLKEAGP